MPQISICGLDRSGSSCVGIAHYCSYRKVVVFPPSLPLTAWAFFIVQSSHPQESAEFLQADQFSGHVALVTDQPESQAVGEPQIVWSALSPCAAMRLWQRESWIDARQPPAQLYRAHSSSLSRRTFLLRSSLPVG